jgi:hypothetical protein
MADEIILAVLRNERPRRTVVDIAATVAFRNRFKGIIDP